MKRKWIILSVAIVLLLLLGWLALRPQLVRRGEFGSNGPVIVLAGLPATLCPTHLAVVVRAGSDLDEKTVELTGCRTLELSRLGVEKKDATILIKLPHALAERVDTTADSGVVPVSVRLGDVNNDNVIDQVDETLLTRELWTKSTTGADIDSDGSVTAADLGLVRLNRGVGVDKADGKPWGASQ